jgi:hypothetical protein
MTAPLLSTPAAILGFATPTNTNVVLDSIFCSQVSDTTAHIGDLTTPFPVRGLPRHSTEANKELEQFLHTKTKKWIPGGSCPALDGL